MRRQGPLRQLQAAGLRQVPNAQPRANHVRLRAHGCAGPAIRALGLHNFGPAIGADELAEDEKPLCPECQRADTAKARATVAKAKAEQLRRDLPDDVALVRTMLPRVKTGQLRRALAEWLANPAAPRKRPRQS